MNMALLYQISAQPALTYCGFDTVSAFSSRSVMMYISMVKSICAGQGAEEERGDAFPNKDLLTLKRLDKQENNKMQIKHKLSSAGAL